MGLGGVKILRLMLGEQGALPYFGIHNGALAWRTISNAGKDLRNLQQALPTKLLHSSRGHLSFQGFRASGFRLEG